jgi:hypothetical protein
MAEQNGPQPRMTDDAIAGILEPLLAKGKELLAERARVKLELDMLDDEIKRVDRIIRAADPTTKPGPKTKSKAPEHRVSPQLVAKVLAAAKARGDEAFSADELMAATGMSRGPINYSLRVLRDNDEVRMIGRMPRPDGHRGQVPYGYKVMS